MGKPDQKNSSSPGAQLYANDLTAHQREIAATWIKLPIDRRSQRLFTAAWPYANAVNIKKKELASGAEPTENAKRLLRVLEARITPAKTQRAKEEQRAIVALCHEYVKQYGAPRSPAELIKWLRSRNGLIATRNLKDAKGRSMRLRLNGERKRIVVSEATVGNIIRSVFGLKWSRGRKTNRKKTDARSVV